MTTLHLIKSMGRSPLRLALLLIPLVFACFALSPTAQAVSPAPDGGYPGGNTAEGQNALFRDSWTIGQYQNIHWSRQNPSGNTVDIDYSTDNGTTWIRIATQAPDTGWYLWNVRGPATTTAKVRIRDHETSSMTDTSEAVFRIVSP
jgi:hypothetical protein